MGPWGAFRGGPEGVFWGLEKCLEVPEEVLGFQGRYWDLRESVLVSRGIFGCRKQSIGVPEDTLSSMGCIWGGGCPAKAFWGLEKYLGIPREVLKFLERYGGPWGAFKGGPGKVFQGLEKYLGVSGNILGSLERYWGIWGGPGGTVGSLGEYLGPEAGAGVPTRAFRGLASHLGSLEHISSSQ